MLRPKQIKVYFGGRVGAKTVSFSKIALFMARQRPLRVIGVREFMSSIKESVHSSIVREIGVLNMSDFFTPLDTQIKGRNGSLFFYMGISRNPSAVKSLDDVDILWNEEAEYTSQKSLDIIIPTIIRKPGAEIWFSFNPEDEFGPVYARFVKPYLDIINSQGFYEDETLYVCKVGIDDNPFASESIKQDAAKMKAENYKKWLWIYGGECYSDYKESIIKPEWFDAAIDAHKKLNFKPLGAKSIGFDLADTGDDKALAMRHGSVITHAKRWSHGELPAAIDIGFKKSQEWGAKYLVYDGDGLGASMKVYLDKVAIGDSVTVEPYRGGATPDFPDDIYIDNESNSNYFRNKRAQYYWLLRDRFEATYNAVTSRIYTDPDKLISISSDIEDIDVLKSELIKIKKVRNNNTKLQIQSKKDAAKEGIKSPNMADALKMCFANPSVEIIKPVNLNFTSEF
jgi:phage terminase large subunit